MRRLPVTLLLCLASSFAMGAKLKGAVYSPGPGILCDKKAQFCADDQGISLGYTKEYLGQKAENAMMARINEGGGPSNYDLTLVCVQQRRRLQDEGEGLPCLQAQ
jgi:hypothetical protein